MLREKIRQFRNTVLYDSRYVRVVETNDSYKITKEYNGDIDITVRVGENEYPLEQSQEYPLDTDSNITILQYGDQKYTIGSKTTEKTFTCYITEQQLQNLEEFTINSENILESDEFDLSVRLLSDYGYSLTVSGFLENVDYEARVRLSGGFPDVKLSCELFEKDPFDLTEIEERFITVDIPSQLEGKCSISRKSVELSELNERKKISEFGSDMLFIMNWSNIDEEIAEWNTNEINLIALPKFHTPVQKTVEYDSEHTVITFNQSEFEPTSRISITYRRGIDVSPYISYDTSEYDHIPNGLFNSLYKYPTEKNVEEETVTYTFKSVLPAESINIFPSSQNGYTFRRPSKLGIETDSTYQLCHIVDPSTITATIENPYENDVIVDINSESIYVNSDDTKRVKVDVTEEDNNITVTKNGEEIFNETYSKFEVLKACKPFVC